MADVVSPELEAKLNANATQPMEPTGEDAPRSTRRQKAMATINAAILASQEQAQQTNTTAPAPPPELTPGQALFLKEQRAQRQEEEAKKVRLSKEQEQILAAQEKLLGKEEAKRLRKEQEDKNNRHALVKAAGRTWRNASRILHGADLSIGSLPSPGGIAFPLILLLLFFFLLIQVNGNSRVGWLWQVLTKNASVGTGYLGQAGNVDTGIPVPTDGPVQQTGQGGELPQVTSYPMLPANGVYAVNGMY